MKYYYDECIYAFKDAFAISFAETIRYQSSVYDVKQRLISALTIGPKTTQILIDLINKEFPQYEDILSSLLLLV